MKTKALKELRLKTKAELQTMLQRLQGELVELRFKLKLNQLPDVKAAAKVRNQIAIIKTIMPTK